MKTLFLVLSLALFAGPCSSLRPLKPGDSGVRSITSTNGVAEFSAKLTQPENPAQSAKQNFERTVETETPLPAGSSISENGKVVVLAAPTTQKTRVVERAGTILGAAQKDRAREMMAKLSSLKGVMWVGVVVFLFGLATFFYPPLRVIIGSLTTSAAITGGGLALIILPTVIVGNELLILGGVFAVVAVWFLAHRHGSLRGKIEALKPQTT